VITSRRAALAIYVVNSLFITTQLIGGALVISSL
jgi:hypothetical protein